MAQEIADSKLLDTWGSSGTKIEPDISKIIEGWQLGEQPPHEYMNWLQNTFGSKLNHILKNGIAEWNNETEYLAGASVKHSGIIWICETTNTNSEPTELNANWGKVAINKDLTVTVDTLDDLRSISYPANTVWASGYHAKNDGAFGSHIFRLKGVKTTETDNGGTVIIATIGGFDYVYELQYSGAINVKWFGAVADYDIVTKTGTNNTNAIQAAINYAGSVNGTLIFEKGVVYLTDSLYVHNGYITIDGNNSLLYPAGNLGSNTWALINVISTTDTDRPFIWTKVNHVTIKNLVINYDSANVPNPTTSPYHMVEVFYSDNFVLENCRLINNYISDIDTTRGSAFVVRGECNNVVMRDCYINNIKEHGVGHTNRYVEGNYTIAAGVSGTDTYASKTEISGVLRPKNTLYENNTINNCRGYALDTHTVGGICTIQNNHSIGCTAFNKDQYGATHIIGNYIEQGVNTFDLLILVGYDNSYIESTRTPKVSMVIRDNFFKNCVGRLKIDRQCVISGNTFYSDSFTYAPDNNRLSLNIQQTENIIISNNIFREYWDTGYYIEAKATSPSIQNQIIIEGNIFELYSNFNAQYRLINLHSTSYVSIVANTFNEVGTPVSPAFPVFCLAQDSNYVTVSNNTSMYGGTSTSQTLFWNVTAGKTRHIITSNIAPNGVVSGTVDVNANNILVV